VILQLLTLIHYHFLFATACHLRCHLSEAYASARVAIDAALIAAHIIEDRASQVAYAKREKPFDNLMRHIGQRMKARKPLPHRLVPLLVKQYKLISTFASHADVNTFVHRIRTTRQDGKIAWMGVEYFQFSRNDGERKIHAFSIFHTFVMALDIFAEFLILEKKAVPKKWKAELHNLGKEIERRNVALKADAKTTGPR
jgi:hypothetical protein